jgi:hypothetical protein
VTNVNIPHLLRLLHFIAQEHVLSHTARSTTNNIPTADIDFGRMSTSNGITTSKRKDSLPSLSPASLKKRRVLEEKSQNINTPPSVVHQSRGLKPSSQNIKSSFEEDLNRLTQEIGEVGDSTHTSSNRRLTLAPFETDQKWNRPEVKPFNPEKDSFSTSYPYKVAYE